MSNGDNLSVKEKKPEVSNQNGNLGRFLMLTFGIFCVLGGFFTEMFSIKLMAGNISDEKFFKNCEEVYALCSNVKTEYHRDADGGGHKSVSGDLTYTVDGEEITVYEVPLEVGTEDGGAITVYVSSDDHKDVRIRKRNATDHVAPVAAMFMGLIPLLVGVFMIKASVKAAYIPPRTQMNI